MFDVHYHLIDGVDDGPKTIDDSIALADASIAEGVTHIVATPHSDLRYPFRPEINREKLNALQERYKGRLTLALGCDFHLTYDNIVDLERNPSRYTLNGKQYLLVEFADLIPRAVSDVLFRILRAGIVPVITHPERNPALSGDSERLKQWIEMGCLIQVTAGSFLGDFGRRAESAAMDLVRRNMIQLVASDAHSVKWRPPSMRRAYDLLSSEFGQPTADRLCVANPRAVFHGEPLSPQPELDSGPQVRRAPRNGLFARWLGK